MHGRTTGPARPPSTDRSLRRASQLKRHICPQRGGGGAVDLERARPAGRGPSRDAGRVTDSDDDFHAGSLTRIAGRVSDRPAESLTRLAESGRVTDSDGELQAEARSLTRVDGAASGPLPAGLRRCGPGTKHRPARGVAVAGRWWWAGAGPWSRGKDPSRQCLVKRKEELVETGIEFRA